MHSFVTSKNVKWRPLIWPATLWAKKLLKFNLVGSRQRSRQSYCNNKKAYFFLAHPAAVAVECGYGLDTAVITES